MDKLQELKQCIPSQLNPPLNYTVISDVAGLDKVAEFFKRKSVFVIDTETNMTESFYDRRIRTIQIGDKEEQYVIDLLGLIEPLRYTEGLTLESAQGGYKFAECLRPLVDALKVALESKDWLKVGHNLQFDYEMLKWCLGIRMWNLYDTMLAEKVLYAGHVEFKMRGFWALDDCIARYAGLKISKAEQKSFDLTSDLTTNQLEYCGLDCRLPLAIKSGQRDKLVKANLLQACQIEFDAIPAFADMHLNGIKLDTQSWNNILDNVRSDHAKNIAKMDEFFLPVVGNKEMPEYDLDELERIWRTTKDKEERADARKKFMACKKHLKDCQKEFHKYEGQAAINYASNPQLLVALRKLGYDGRKLPDTNDRTLKKASKHPMWDLDKTKKEDPDFKQVDVIDVLRLYRETKKILVSYEAWEKDHINPHTGRIHSRINQLGASTGRTSSTEPNIQNIKRGSDWRACFVAELGWKMITMDYNGCELRILAEYSREKSFLDAFLKDWDVHSVGAEILFGDEWKNAAVTEPYQDDKGKWVPRCSYYFKDNNSVKNNELRSTGTDHQKCSCKAHKDLRDSVKALNFGIAYGMEKKKLAEAINKTEEFAEVLLKKYRETFPTLIDYLTKSAKSAVTKMESRTLANRRRLFNKPTWEIATKLAKADLKGAGEPSTKKISQKYKSMFMSIEREGKNTPIQGSNADIAKIAMGCGIDEAGTGFMWHDLEPKFGAKLVNFVHDEFVVEVLPEKAEECFKYIGDCMTRSGKVLVKLIPMTSEGVISDKWKK
jgi:DNA polymerase-1